MMRWLGLALLALFLLVLPQIVLGLDQPFLLRFATRVLIFGIAAVSLNLLLGYGGLVSMGHAAFAGIAAYVVGILDWHATNDEPLLRWPLHIAGTSNALIAWPVAILLTMAAAGLIGAVCLRMRGINFIMVTLAFAQMLYYAALSLEKYGGQDGLQLSGPSHLPLLRLNDRMTLYYVVLAALAASLLLIHRLIGSRFGMLLQGLRQNERRLRAIGIAPFRYQLATFVLAGGLAGLSGVLMMQHTQFVSPVDLSWEQSGNLLVMVVLGGKGTLLGPLLGVAVYLALELWLGGVTEHWQILFGPVFIVVVLFCRGKLTAVPSVVAGVFRRKAAL